MSKGTGFGRLVVKLLLLMLLAVGLYIYLRNSAWLNIKSIEVKGNRQVASGELQELSGVEIGQNILEADISEAARAISYHPMIQKVTISRSYPDKVVITVQERSLWAVVRYKQSFLCLDPEGYCIDKAASLDIGSYVLISFDELPDYVTLGRPFQPEAVKAIGSVWEGLSASERADISEFHYIMQSKEITIFLVNGTEIRFGDLSRQSEKMELLKKCMDMDTEFRANDGDVIEYVDLRFKGQPVIKTKT